MDFGKCQAVINVSKIKFSEKGQTVNFVNVERLSYIRVQVDGCVMKNGVAADWVLGKDEQAVVIELKGSDLEHGFKQVFETAKLVRENDPQLTTLAGLLVSHQSPKTTTQVQKAKLAYAKAYRSPFHFRSSKGEYTFTEIVKFGNYDAKHGVKINY